MARLYANENFPFPVVEELRIHGHEVLTIQETGKGGRCITDEEVLQFATENNRAVLTLNRKHFIRLHGQRTDHAGIVVCTVDSDFKGQADRIHTAIDAAGDLHGQLIRVNRPSA